MSDTQKSVAFTGLSMACWLVACAGLVYGGGFKYEWTWAPFLATPFCWALTAYWLAKR